MRHRGFIEVEWPPVTISTIVRKNRGLWTIQRLWRRLTNDDQFPFLFRNLDMTLWNLISWEFAFIWKREWTVNSWVKKNDEFMNFVHLYRGMKKMMWRRSTQRNKQFMQLWKESLKISGLPGYEPLTTAILTNWVSKHFSILRPLPHVFVWKPRSTSPVWSTVHTSPAKRVTENASFQKHTPEWRFMKTEIFEKDYVKVLDTSKRACSHQSWSYFQWLLRFCADRQKQFKTFLGPPSSST